MHRIKKKLYICLHYRTIQCCMHSIDMCCLRYNFDLSTSIMKFNFYMIVVFIAIYFHSKYVSSAGFVSSRETTLHRQEQIIPTSNIVTSASPLPSKNTQTAPSTQAPSIDSSSRGSNIFPLVNSQSPPVFISIFPSTTSPPAKFLTITPSAKSSSVPLTVRPSNCPSSAIIVPTALPTSLQPTRQSIYPVSTKNTLISTTVPSARSSTTSPSSSSLYPVTSTMPTAGRTAVISAIPTQSFSPSTATTIPHTSIPSLITKMPIPLSVMPSLPKSNNPTVTTPISQSPSAKYLPTSGPSISSCYTVSVSAVPSPATSVPAGPSVTPTVPPLYTQGSIAPLAKHIYPSKTRAPVSNNV